MGTELQEVIAETTAAAKQAVLEAGAYLTTAFSKNHQITVYNRHEKIAADRQAEIIILEALSKNCSQPFSYESEETSKQLDTNIEFIIDPIEGTSNFARGIPLFATQIAVAINKELVAAYIYDPIKKDLYHAIRNGGAFKNNTRIYVQNTLTPEGALASGSAGKQKPNKQLLAKNMSILAKHVRSTRMYGACGLELSYLASGKLDCYMNIGSNLYDVAAGVLLVKEAGGVITDITNRPWKRTSKTFFAASPKLHQLLIKTIQVE